MAVEIVDKPMDVVLVNELATAVLNMAIDRARDLGAAPAEVMQSFLFAYVNVAMQVSGAPAATDMVLQLRLVLNDFCDEIASGKVAISFTEEETHAVN